MTFDCSRNVVSGNISSKVEKFMKLTSFIIFSNMFTGTIPTELASIEQNQMLMVHQFVFQEKHQTNYVDCMRILIHYRCSMLTVSLLL